MKRKSHASKTSFKQLQAKEDAILNEIEKTIERLEKRHGVQIMYNVDSIEPVS